MHGLGNDFVVIDAREMRLEMNAARAHAIGDRRTGIGCDQLIMLESSGVADVKMRIFNADGGEVEACGNATRCIALLMGGPADVETLGGILHTEPGDSSATVTLNPPAFEWEFIPLAMPMDTRDMPVSWDALARPAAVNVGNPHVIFFVPDCDAVDLEALGPLIENDPLFPERVNVNVAHLFGEGPSQVASLGTRRGADSRLRHGRVCDGCSSNPCWHGSFACKGLPSGRRLGDCMAGWQPDSNERPRDICLQR